MYGAYGRLAVSWGNSFHLAKEAIEKSVNEHQQKQNSRIVNHVPRLVDLAAERLGNLSAENSNSLDDIPPVILGLHIWKWHKVSYPAFRCGLQSLFSDPDLKDGEGPGPSKDIDEWILLNEKWLRDGRAEWQQHGLVTLNDADSVFPNSTATLSGRTITRPDGSLPGFEILCGAREPSITIQPSVDAFKRTFEHMSDGLLKNLNWSNVFVAGGIVLGTLLSVDTADGQLHRDPRWSSSDIDVYIYGLSPTEANEKVGHIFDTFCANLPPGSQTLVVRNCSTITFYAQYPLRRIQIVLKLVESPKTVLLNFDLDICAMGWDGATLWMLPRTARALEVGCNVFTMGLIHGHYLSDRRASTQERLFKYADKGYGIRILPSYISSLATVDLDIASIAAEQRKWTTTRAPEVRVLLDLMPPRVGYRASRCLTGFRVFMRCAILWELVHRGTITLGGGGNVWAGTDYHQDAMTTYDDTPSPPYKWDKDFDVLKFEQALHWSNAMDISNWISTDTGRRLEPYGVVDERDSSELDKYQRTVCANSVDDLFSDEKTPKPANVVNRKRKQSTTRKEEEELMEKDLMLQVLLPCKFADYANDVVSQAQAQAGLPQTQLLTPVTSDLDQLEDTDRAEGLFLWRIGKELMWQQLHRGVDEVFEMLYAFRRVNEHLRVAYAQESRFRAELARREVYDEFDAFARWVENRSLLTRDIRRDPDSDGSGRFMDDFFGYLDGGD
ncbi:hypothetical protein DFH08DRAFT_354212 [Mycena albidolilacea]|uniref:Uncharacterized protein n=1 Tax=Mycena albidolilacea TaxID=1033008 RepID=A0AAD6ZI59_9AGAR|nr:hypothetical protein DFH08DRAFT_354212 [Mycena albidolilacea]